MGCKSARDDRVAVPDVLKKAKAAIAFEGHLLMTAGAVFIWPSTVVIASFYTIGVTCVPGFRVAPKVA
jgi:hypothetical protein